MDNDYVDALIYYDGSISRSESGSVVFYSPYDALLSYVTRTMSYVQLTDSIFELCNRRVEKIRYRYPFSENDALLYKSIVISNDHQMSQMFIRSKRFEECIGGIELYVEFQEDEDVRQNVDEAGPSSSNIILAREIGGSSQQFEQHTEDTDDNESEEDIDSDDDPDVFEHHIQSDESGDEDLAGTSASAEPHNPLPYMHAVDLEGMRPPEYPHFGDRGNYSAEEELRLGLEFDDIDHVKQAVKRYSLRRSVDFKVHESKKTSYYCKCKRKDEGCPWLIRVSLSKRRDAWVVTKYGGSHNCVVRDQSSDHPKLDADMIAKEIEGMVQSDPSLKIKTVQAEMLNIYGFRPSYTRAWMAKQKAIARWYGNWEESYAELPKWLTALRKADPDSIFKMETYDVYTEGQLVPDVQMFNRFFWTFGPLRKSFDNCKSIIEVDGTHLYGQYKETLLIATSQDGNDNTLAIAFAIVEGETADAWGFFFENIRRYIVTDREVTFISDRHASIIAAMERMGNQWNVNHVFCLRHIAANFKREFKQKFLEGQVMGIGMSTTAIEFERRYEKLRARNAQYTAWLDQIPVEKWVCAFDGGRRYGQMTTNLAECMNHVYKGTRSLPIAALVEASYFRSVKDFGEKLMKASARIAAGQIYSDTMSQRLEASRRMSLGLEATLFSRAQLSFHVRDPGNTKNFHVNLGAWFCECGLFQTMRYPCPHVLAACGKVNRDWTMYVDKVYKNASVLKVYQHDFGVIGNKDLWPRYRGPRVVPNSERKRNAKGRPKSTRFRNEMDSRDVPRQRRCGNCRQSGHNRSECPYS